MHLHDIFNCSFFHWCAKFIWEQICKLATFECQINVPPRMLISEFFVSPPAMLIGTSPPIYLLYQLFFYSPVLAMPIQTFRYQNFSN